MPKFNPNSGEITYLFGGGFDESLIKLSITHEELDPKKVTAALHLKPTKAYRKGELLPNKKRKYNHGMWQIATSWVSNLEFEENLTRFLKKLPSDRRIWRGLVRRYNCELVAVLRMRTFNRGAHIDSQVLDKIASRGLKFELDVYYDDDAKLWSEKKIPNQPPEPTS